MDKTYNTVYKLLNRLYFPSSIHSIFKYSNDAFGFKNRDTDIWKYDVKSMKCIRKYGLIDDCVK